MSFKEVLNAYIIDISCSAKELSRISGLSAATISRYRNGERIPEYGSDVVEKLAAALEELSKKQPGKELAKSVIFQRLNETLKEQDLNREDLLEHLNSLLTALEISSSELAASMFFDASYVSRIRKGQRQPADWRAFIENTCAYVVNKCSLPVYRTVLENLTGEENLQNCTDAELLSILQNWFFKAKLQPKQNQVKHFLDFLDMFDLNNYIKAVHFDELKVPTIPFQLNTSKTYYGIEGQRQAELDFFKTTVLSKAKEAIFMCSDMPMEDMAADVEWSKKWMFGIAMALKKGLELTIIHNINRPLQEMLLGLESWIPLYMTGQIKPYYMPETTGKVYGHLLYVSGYAALSGECVMAHHDEGRMYLTRNKAELAYYRKRSEQILQKGRPLMQIFQADRKREFQLFMSKKSADLASRRMISSTLPIWTISIKLLEKMLDRENIQGSIRTEMLEYVMEEKKQIEQFLQQESITVEIYVHEDAEEQKVMLPLAAIFPKLSKAYTREEYLQHVKETRNYAKEYESFCLKECTSPTFHNMDILIQNNSWVLISKCDTPITHFFIEHPQMVKVMENFVAPVVETGREERITDNETA